MRWIARLIFAAAILFAYDASAMASQEGSDLAPTPPMGWANWNSLGCNYDESIIRAIADHMVSYGMRDAGYPHMELSCSGWFRIAGSGHPWVVPSTARELQHFRN
jgi:alpha-galactosidase